MKFDNQVSNLSLIAISTILVVNVFTSFSFVWPWNSGSLIKTDKIDPNKQKDYLDYLTRVAFSDTHSPHDGLALAEMLHEDYGFQSSFINESRGAIISGMDATMLGPFNINISFGGTNNFTIVSCYVNNFGSSIQISEDVILQEFSFFGRNIIH